MVAMVIKFLWYFSYLTSYLLKGHVMRKKGEEFKKVTDVKVRFVIYESCATKGLLRRVFVAHDLEDILKEEIGQKK